MKVPDHLLEEDALPHGASVVVYRRTAVGTEFLMLHRAHSGSDYEGDWAWTPPAGVRLPGEPIDDCARRELWEETGFELTITPTRCGSATWPTYIAEAPPGMSVSLDHDPEHDRYEWLSASDALARCRPMHVCEALSAAIRRITRRRPPSQRLFE